MGEEADDRLAVLRARLLERLAARADQVEEGIVAAAVGVGLTTEGEAEGRERLRGAAKELVAMIGEVIEEGARWTPKLPPAVAAEVRGLARIGVGLEAVMRGYYATSALCFEFASSEGTKLPEGTLSYLIAIQGWHGDALLAIVADEFNDEVARLERTPSARRRADQVRRLLAGELVEAPDLDYELDGWHVGLVVLGGEGEAAMRRPAERLGCRLLTVAQGAEVTWAWLGSERPVALAELERTAPIERLRMTCGETREGLAGWRLSHREAAAAVEVMRHGDRHFVRCADVALEAGVLREEALHRALVDTYLRPLGEGREGRTLRDTLRAYLACDLNAASAAASLAVDRHTIQRRLRRVEELIGRSPQACRAELEVALRVGER
jgi:hypothetical protein